MTALLDATRPRPGTVPVRSAAPWGLTVGAVLAAAVAGAWTLADPGLLVGPAAMQGSARGTGLVMLAVALPLLLVAGPLARRGSYRAALVWAGGLVYLLYNAVLLLFLTPFNAAFLVYVALLSLALWSLVALLRALDVEGVRQRLALRAPVRVVASYVVVVVVLNALAWLGSVVPHLGDGWPNPMLEGTGVATNAAYVQDLAVWLPIGAAGAVWLWRRLGWGAVVAGTMLTFWTVESVSIAVDQAFGHQADPTSPVVSDAMVLPFAVLAVVNLVFLVLLLRRADN